MKLNQQQINFFHTFGYLIVRRAFSPFETAQIIEAFEWSIQNFSGGMEHDGSRRTMFPGPIEHHENLCALMDHPVILGLIGGVTGEEFYYAGGDGNYYCGDTHWHPDGGWGRLLATKTAFYLDSLTSDSGALRVIPGSHHANHIIRRAKINIDNSMSLFGVPPENFPGSVVIPTNPGDVVIFNHDLYHASFGGGQRRRMFTMNCTIKPTTVEEEELVTQYFRAHTLGSNNYVSGSGMYYPRLIETADEQRMLHMQRPIEIHDQLFPHLAR